MPGIDFVIIAHKLNVDLEAIPVKQRKRKISKEKNEVIKTQFNILT